MAYFSRPLSKIWRFSAIHRSFSSTVRALEGDHILSNLRHLLRHTAQPVSVITTNLAFPSSSIHRHDHGATLSSFSSISFNPPLVAFSLRLPSRLATALLQPGQAFFHVHLLEQEQETLAKTFARQVKSDEEGFSTDAFEQLERGALGTLECRLAHTVTLDNLVGADQIQQSQQQTEVKSCLFMAQVLDVRPGQRVKGRPLVWHDQQYRAV